MQQPSTSSTKRRAALAVAIFAGLASLVPTLSANAQQAPIVLSPLQASFSATAGQTYTLKDVLRVDPTGLPYNLQGIQIIKQGGVRLSGDAPTVAVGSIEQLLTTQFSATADGVIQVIIQGFTTVPAVVPFQAVGVAVVKFVPAATTVPATTAPATTAPATTAPPPPVVATTAPPPPVVATPAPSNATTAATAPPAAGGGNRPPVAQSTQVLAGSGQSTDFSLTASDPDGNALTFVLAQLPTHGKLSGQAPKLSYTADAGYLGTDALVFTASDGKDSSGQATVTFTVTGSNAPLHKTIARSVVARRRPVSRPKPRVKVKAKAKSH